MFNIHGDLVPSINMLSIWVGGTCQYLGVHPETMANFFFLRDMFWTSQFHKRAMLFWETPFFRGFDFISVYFSPRLDKRATLKKNSSKKGENLSYIFILQISKIFQTGRLLSRNLKVCSFQGVCLFQIIE